MFRTAKVFGMFSEAILVFRDVIRMLSAVCSGAFRGTNPLEITGRTVGARGASGRTERPRGEACT